MPTIGTILVPVILRCVSGPILAHIAWAAVSRATGPVGREDRG